MSPPDDAPAIDLTDRTVYATWSQDLVRYADLDPNGHVNNGAVNQYFEDGRVGFRAQRMTGVLENLFTRFAIARFDATYRGALTYPATVEIGTVVTRIGNSSFELGQGVFEGARCIATARVTTVYFDPATGRSEPIPGPIRDVLEGALAPGARG